MDPHFLDLGTRWRWVVSFTSRPLYPREKTPPPGTHWIGGWMDPRAGLDDLKKRKFLTLSGLGTPTHRSSSPSPVTIPTELSQLSVSPVYSKICTQMCSVKFSLITWIRNVFVQWPCVKRMSLVSTAIHYHPRGLAYVLENCRGW
jgi:hypothetical protein